MGIQLLLQASRSGHQIRPLEDPAGVELHQRSARTDPLPGHSGASMPPPQSGATPARHSPAGDESLRGPADAWCTAEATGLLGQGATVWDNRRWASPRRSRLVFTAITPANPSSKASRAMASIASSSRSGAIFTSRGGQAGGAAAAPPADASGRCPADPATQVYSAN